MKSRKEDGVALNEKVKSILNKGSYISKTKFKNLEIFVYKVDEQFYEIWYDINRKKIIKTCCMDGQSIDPYLKHMGVMNLN